MHIISVPYTCPKAGLCALTQGTALMRRSAAAKGAHLAKRRAPQCRGQCGSCTCMRRRASAASDRSTVRDSLMRASDSLILIRLSSCLGVAVMVCAHSHSDAHILLLWIAFPVSQRVRVDNSESWTRYDCWCLLRDALNGGAPFWMSPCAACACSHPQCLWLPQHRAQDGSCCGRML